MTQSNDKPSGEGATASAVLTAKRPSTEAQISDGAIQHPLYHNKACQWAGCESYCSTVPEFLEHLIREHGLSDKTTAQCRVQTQVVAYLQAQAKKERQRLSAMMAHLHSIPSKSLCIDAIFSLNEDFPESPPSPPDPQPTMPAVPSALTSAVSLAAAEDGSTNNTNTATSEPVQTSSLAPLTSTAARTISPVVLQPGASTDPLTTLGRLTDYRISPIKEICSSNSGFSPILSTPALPSFTSLTSFYDSMLPRLDSPQVETSTCKLRSNSAPTPGSILANAALYQNPSVKPPFTYASLIREAIINSPAKRMSLNEIYTWFSNTFAFFRYNNSQWKNAVRHNLSLHKCFQRVEGPAGSGWTVNESEFQLRRANRVHTSHSANNPTPASSRATEDSAARGDAARAAEGTGGGGGGGGGLEYIKNLREHVNNLQGTLTSDRFEFEAHEPQTTKADIGFVSPLFNIERLYGGRENRILDWPAALQIPQNLGDIAQTLLSKSLPLVKQEMQ